MANGMYVFPQTECISTNSWIVLQGYAGSQKTITSLQNESKIYLKADDHLVRMQVREIHVGMFNLTQAILVPEENLIAGKTYYLKLEHHLENNTVWRIKRNPTSYEREDAKWKVEPANKAVPPKFITKPSYADKSCQFYGCGPAIYAYFNMDVKNSASVLVFTQLEDLATGETHSYYLNIKENENLGVGHGMCSGSFNFKQKGKYKVRFKLYDYSGISSKEWSDWIEFRSPFERT
jgi:hypothetical protein